jgi:hypothetical protein
VSRQKKEALLQEKLWRRCKADEQFFLDHYWKIRVPGKGLVQFDAREAQREAIRHWGIHRYSVTLKARQIGWSTLVGAHQFWLAFFHPDREILDISRGERESIDLLKKSKIGYRNLPLWMLERGPKLLSEHVQQMPFDNGSIIKSLPSASDPARGSSAFLIVVDEWGFLPNAEEAWASIEPVADIGGNVIGLSTANGSGNFFHNLWIGSESGENNFANMFFPWSAVDDRDEAWYEAKKRSMSEWQLAQEYPTTPEEAFIKSGRPVFNIDIINQMEQRVPELGYLHVYGA